MDANQNEILTKKELAGRLKMTASGIDKYMRKRKIPFIKLGRRCVRFDWEKVQEALTARTIPARALPTLRPRS
jgi:excisionase family DNA binding protein